MAQNTNTNTKSFKDIILPKIAFVLGFGFAAFVLSHWLTAGLDEIIDVEQGTPGDAMEIREPVKDSPSFVYEKHKDTCWTMNEEPKAELPGAAIVQFNDGRTKYVTNETPRGFKLVDAAFNEALAAVGYGDKTSDKIDVIALCK